MLRRKEAVEATLRKKGPSCPGRKVDGKMSYVPEKGMKLLFTNKSELSFQVNDGVDIHTVSGITRENGLNYRLAIVLASTTRSLELV